MHALRPGGPPLPGFPGWRFAGTVLLQELHYRYKAVGRILHPDPVLVALEGARAILEIEVLRSPGSVPAGSVDDAATPGVAGAGASGAGDPLPPDGAPPARATLDGELLEKVRVREAGPGLYEVPAGDVQAVLDNAGRVLADRITWFMQRLKTPNGLRDVGYSSSDIPALVEGTLPQHRVTKLSPRPAGPEELSRLFEDAMVAW